MFYKIFCLARSLFAFNILEYITIDDILKKSQYNLKTNLSITFEYELSYILLESVKLIGNTIPLSFDKKIRSMYKMYISNNYLINKFCAYVDVLQYNILLDISKVTTFKYRVSKVLQLATIW